MQLASDLATPMALPPARRRIVADGVLGMAMFVFTEVMLFSGFVSAFTIVKSSAPLGIWPPADQPRLPLEATALNTAALLLSGVLLHLAWRTHRKDALRGGRLLTAAIALGGLFVLLQGIEWVALIGQGLTLTSSQLGSFFYLVVGAHGLHAVGALVALGWAWSQHRKGQLTGSAFSTVQLLWVFVVGMWPIIYLKLYL
jgi:cytochrome c oxidase subunit III